MSNIKIDVTHLTQHIKHKDGSVVVIQPEIGKQSYALRYPDGSIIILDSNKNDSTYD